MNSAWLFLNLLLLGPPAVVCVAFGREGIRIAVAITLGFQLFGIRWGTGPELFRLRWGAVHHHFRAIPFSADARVASSLPRHHRLARWCLTLSPLLCQSLFAAATLVSGGVSFASLSDGFAFGTMIQVANLMLLGVHLCLPFETRLCPASDWRLLSLMAMTGPDADRATRATALILRIERCLELGEVKRATRELDHAIVQLGRVPSLIQLEDRLTQIARNPRPDAAARTNARTDPFELPDTAWDRGTRRLSFVQRIAFGSLGIAPAAIAATFFVAYQYDSMWRAAHAEWIEEAQTLSIRNDKPTCRDHLTILDQRLSRMILASEIPRELQIAELRARSMLHACVGDFDRAVRDQSLAVQIADTLRKQRSANVDPDSREQIEAELIHSSELRQLAAWHAARGALREALRATRLAEEELEVADHRAIQSPPSLQRDWARGVLARERQELEQTRRRILDGANVRS